MDDARSKFIYEQLNTLKLGDDTATDIQRLQDQVNIQAVNIEAMKTYNLINEASFRLSGTTMPDTGEIKRYVQTNDTDYQDIKPPKGEVWNIQSISVENDPSVTGSNTYFFYWGGTGAPTGLNGAAYHSAISSGSNNIPAESLFEEVFQPLKVTNTAFLRVYSNMDNVGTGAVVNWQVAYHRLR
jgi:hypothetical protein